MLNILIADDNIDYARNLMHFINSNSDKVRVSDISIDVKETLEILNNSNNIDIVILDLKMPFLNSIEIINKLSSEQINKYTNSFILISDEIQFIKQSLFLNYKVVYKIIQKNLDIKCIVDNINQLVEEKYSNENDENIRLQISNQLTSIGYSLSHIGTQYLIDIIEMIYICGQQLTKNLNKYVYPLIAKRYNQSANNIKISVIRATEYMYFSCQEEKLLEYFCLNTVINTILLKIATF